MRNVILPLALTIGSLANAALGDTGCKAISPTGPQPFTAESYVLPLSLRINLILLLKRELHAIGEYGASTEDAVFTDLLETKLRTIQRARDEPETGCISWQIVTFYDSRKRVPPGESLQ